MMRPQMLIFMLMLPVVSGAAPRPAPASTGAYFGNAPPGLHAEPFVFPPDFVQSGHYVRSVTFARDGKQAYWPVIDLDNDYRRWIVVSRYEAGGWTPPLVAPFSDRSFYDDVPYVAGNGNKLFFTSGRPLEEGGSIDKERIWFMTRVGETWSDPTPLPEHVNGPYTIHQQVSVDGEGRLYFSGEAGDGQGSLDIYCSRYEEGEYRTPLNLGPVINGPHGDYGPTISPDGHYLVFTRNLDEGWSLFVSFRTPDDNWTPPVDLREYLPGFEESNLSGSFISHDGKYLVFFGNSETSSQSYWVDTAFIEKLRPGG